MGSPRRRPRPLLGLLVALAVLGVLELAAHLLPFPPSVKGIPLKPHPTRIWTLDESGEPLGFRVGPGGFRASAVEGPDGAPLVLTLGDSSVFGDGIPDGSTIHDVLAAELGRAGHPTRARTLAVPGYSTFQSRIVLDEAGWAMDPALLVVGNLWSDSKIEVLRDVDVAASLKEPAARVEWTLGRSALFRKARAWINVVLGRPPHRIVAWPDGHNGTVGIRRVPLEQYAANLEAILDGARERGVGVIVLTLTDRDSVYIGINPHDPARPYIRVQQEVARRRGVPVLEVREMFAAHANEELLKDHIHPSEQGSRLIGASIAEFLLAEGWPEVRPIPASAPPMAAPFDPFRTQRFAPNDVGKPGFLESL